MTACGLRVSTPHANVGGMDLEVFAADLGVSITEAPTVNGHWGEYLDDLRLIVLTPGLGPAQYRSTLAHELGHAFYRHTATIPLWERQADAFAASILLTQEDVAQAAIFHETTEGIAAELGVLPWVVETHYEMRNPDGPS